MVRDALTFTGLYFAGIALARGRPIGIGVRYCIASAAPFAFASATGSGFGAALLLVPATVWVVWWLERRDAVLYAAVMFLCGYSMFGLPALFLVLGAALPVWMGSSPYHWDIPSRNNPAYWVFLLYILLGTIVWTM
ncbi:MAG: hypothetical protein BWK73_25450 [Thiothrix lacustris]|uniref:Uncharacterized protein n=1 Tax=Thiothrix lacustris TaxID=525917 RepID=A0A1Y1QLS9_9GAMM|nr:MAG: hypothetical protein BWK73_25450 [Thiothrix lacustris]